MTTYSNQLGTIKVAFERLESSHVMRVHYHGANYEAVEELSPEMSPLETTESNFIAGDWNTALRHHFGIGGPELKQIHKLVSGN